MGGIGRARDGSYDPDTVRPTGELLELGGGGHWARRGQVKEPPEGPGGQLQWIMPTIAPPQQGQRKPNSESSPGHRPPTPLQQGPACSPFQHPSSCLWAVDSQTTSHNLQEAYRMASYIPFGPKLPELFSSQTDLNGPFEPLGAVEDRFGCGDWGGHRAGGANTIRSAASNCPVEVSALTWNCACLHSPSVQPPPNLWTNFKQERVPSTHQ